MKPVTYYTELGIWLQVFKYRRGIRLYDMAKKLGCSSAFLCALATGKKAVPVSFFDKMKSQYELDEKDCKGLMDAIKKTKAAAAQKAKAIYLKIDNLHPWTSKLAFVFARRVNYLNEQQRTELLGILENESQ